MWITKDKDFDGCIYLWKIKPVRWIDRFNSLPQEYKDEYINFVNKEYDGVMPSHNVWTYPYEFTKALGKSEYLYIQDILELDSEYRIPLNPDNVPYAPKWEDEAFEVNIVPKIDKKLHQSELCVLDELRNPDMYREGDVCSDSNGMKFIKRT